MARVTDARHVTHRDEIPNARLGRPDLISTWRVTIDTFPLLRVAGGVNKRLRNESLRYSIAPV